MPRTEHLDSTRSEAWNVLRLLAEWGGEGTPLHEEGRRIITAARSKYQGMPGGLYGDAMDVIDPTGKSFPVAITAAWDARKANA